MPPKAQPQSNTQPTSASIGDSRVQDLQNSFPPPLTAAGQINRARREQNQQPRSSYQPSPALQVRLNSIGNSSSPNSLPTAQSPEGQLNVQRQQARQEAEEEENEQEEAKQKKKKKKPGKIQKAMNEAQKASQEATRSWLRTAWLSVKPTFGLSMFYVWFHYIMRYIANSNFFSKFGDTFSPIPPSKSKLGSKAMRFIGLEVFEKIAAGMMFLFLIMIIWGALTSIALPIYFVQRPDVGLKIGAGFLKSMLGI